jgi:hypothetical protein
MWALTNNTPFAAERSWVRDKNGAEVWLVAVKGTFLIGPDGLTHLADDQMEVYLAPKFQGKPDQSSLLYESDLVHTKSSTDVILQGHAYTPREQLNTEVDVTLKVVNINKTLRVIGDRIWQDSLLGLKMSKPKPFTKMPLTYERAFGGTDQTSENPKHHGWEPRNPVGSGFATRMEHLVGKPAPNIEDPKSLIRNWKDRPRPLAFGPIAGHWSPRIKFAGTYDEKWKKERLPLLPEDFDERFYQCAPEDQQVPGFLKGGELVELHNFTPSGFLWFRLPCARLSFTTYFDDFDEKEHYAVVHTVIIEPDVPRVIMVWHTNLPCHHKVQKLLNTAINLDGLIHVSEQDLASDTRIGEPLCV